MRYDNEECCKIWNRINLPFQNWHEVFNKFWPEHSKISKICFLMGWFWPKYIITVLKNTEELRLIALKIDKKFEGKLPCASKNWHEEISKFSPQHLKVSKLEPWWHPFG